MDSIEYLVCSKFKFCFWSFCGIIFLYVFHSWLVEFMDEKPTDTESWLQLPQSSLKLLGESQCLSCSHFHLRETAPAPLPRGHVWGHMCLLLRLQAWRKNSWPADQSGWDFGDLIKILAWPITFSKCKKSPLIFSDNWSRKDRLLNWDS